MINEYCREQKIVLRTYRAQEKEKIQCGQHKIINNLILLSTKSTWHGNYFTHSKTELSAIKTYIT